MLSYCFKLTKRKNAKVAKTKERNANGFIKMCSVW